MHPTLRAVMFLADLIVQLLVRLARALAARAAGRRIPRL